MISQLAVLTAFMSSSSSVGVTTTEAQGIFQRLCQTTTVQQQHRAIPLQIKETSRAEVALWYPDGVTISQGFLRQHTEEETAWALALHIGGRVRPAEDAGCDSRTGLRILREAGYDPFGPAANWHRQIDYIRRLGPDWQVAALALQLTYGPATYTEFRGPARHTTPITGTVESVWSYDDPAWTEWFAAETGRDRPSPRNRFAAGQCTALALALFPDFPIDPRAGGRNDAKNWFTVAKAAGWRASFVPTYLSIGVQDSWGSNPAGHVFVCLGQTEDGKIRAIDSNFGKQPDNKVRVRTFEPDDEIIGYVSPPTSPADYPQRLSPHQTTLPPEAPYWHAKVDGRMLSNSRAYALQFRIRTQSKRDFETSIYTVSSTGQTESKIVRVKNDWQTVSLGAFSRSGGGDVIPHHFMRSLVTYARRNDNEATFEIAEPILVPVPW